MRRFSSRTSLRPLSGKLGVIDHGHASPKLMSQHRRRIRVDIRAQLRQTRTLIGAGLVQMRLNLSDPRPVNTQPGSLPCCGSSSRELAS